MISKRLMRLATPIINDIAKTNSVNGVFAYFESDDIFQEVWIICIQALSEYRRSRGELEHYLRRCVANRLKNLKRDRYFAPHVVSDDQIKDRINIVNALPMGDGAIAQKMKQICAPSSQEPSAVLDAAELQQAIEHRLSTDLLASFEQLMNGYPIPKTHLIAIQQITTTILKQRNA